MRYRSAIRSEFFYLINKWTIGKYSGKAVEIIHFLTTVLKYRHREKYLMH